MDSNTKILAVAVIVGIAVFGAVLWWPSGTTVVMKDKIYTPKDLRIKVGERVTFVNKDTEKAYWPASNIHPSHEIYSEFDPKKSIRPGASWSFVFNKKGEWKYHDHLFPEIVGTIVVE